METINSVKELKAAIKAGKSPLVPGNKRMKYILAVTASIFSLTGGTGALPAVGTIAGNMVSGGMVAGAISETTVIILALGAMVTAISIVALCKGQGVRIKWDDKRKVFVLETY